MPIDPAIVSGGVGLLTSLFGGGGGGTDYMAGLYKLYEQILNEGMNIYRTTDLDELFRQSQERYREVVDEQVSRGLRNYNAGLLAGGVKPTGGDTEQSVQRGMVRQKGATRLAEREADFLLQKPMMQKSLLPGVGDATAGMGMAGHLDAMAAGRGAANRNAMGQVGDFVTGIINNELKRKSGSTSGYKPNGSYNPWWKE